MSKQSKHCMQNKLHSIARMSKQSIHCVQNKLDSMFLPITFLIFNGFSIRKKFWNAENQGFPTIPPNPIYVEAVEACTKQSIHCVQNKLHSIACMSKQSIHCVQNKLDSWYVDKHCMQNKLHSIARMSKQSIHCVQNKLDSMFLPITFLIFNGFSIRKKFWNAENQGFPTIPPNPIYVEAVEACRSSRYIVYKINYIQWYACRSSRYIVYKIN